MFTSLSEFKFFQSFRIPVESRDDMRFMIEFENDLGKFEYINDADLKDISITGVGFQTKERISVGKNLRMSFQFKRLRMDLEGRVVRAFGSAPDDTFMLYGVEVDSEDQPHMKKLLEQYIGSFTPERSREVLADLSLSERYKNATEGFEVFSLMLSLFKDITAFGSQESFVRSMLEEVTRILNAQRASIYLINPETNELEAISALGIDKEALRFDYRKGIIGSVFTSGIPLNIDTQSDEVRFSRELDKLTGLETKSILCHHISNREDKVIGVIEIINKRNEDRFTVEDEKTIKVLAVIFSSVFHNFNPISEKSLIRRFSTPYDREFAYIGKSQNTNDIRKAIVRLKDIDTPLLITGEMGTGKKLLAQIIHNEGKRGLNQYREIFCKGVDPEDLHLKIFGGDGVQSYLEECVGGTVCFEEVTSLSLKDQATLLDVLKTKRIPGSKFHVDIRPIFTSSESIAKLVQEGAFNRELAEFIGTAHVVIEPLRKRSEDIEDLLIHFLKKECHKQGLLMKEFSEEVVEKLTHYDWPGNVIELQKAVEKAVLYHPKSHLISSIEKGATPIVDMAKQSMTGLDSIPYARDYNLQLKDRVALVEREMILAEIKRHKGNKSKAAKSMGISREALRKKLLISDQVLHDVEEQSNVKKAA